MYDSDNKYGWTFTLGPIYAFRYNNRVVVILFNKEVMSWQLRSR